MKPITSVAALKRLPIGTKLYLVRSLLGPNEPKGRIVEKVQSNAIVFTVNEPGAKNHGSQSWLWLPSGTKIEPRDNGFAVLEPDTGEVGAEYRFAS